MAGLFLKMDLDLAESEPVVIISDITGDSVELVIGKLFRFWRWVERHCGASRGVTRMSRLVTLARVTSCDEVFLKALIDVGWLAMVDGVYVIPNWEKRFSHTAKEKDSSAERQRRCREKKKAESCHGSVTPKRDKSSRQNVTEALPELEEELEVDKELIPPNPPSYRVPFLIPLPAALNQPEFEAVWKRWMQYLMNRNHGRVAQDTLESQLVEFAKIGIPKSIEVIEAAILKGHAGPVMPGDKFGAGKQPQPIPQL